jgi:AmiR/NasT family two-component response regulator
MSKLKETPNHDSAHAGRQSQVVVYEPDRPIRALLAEWLQMAGYDFIEGHLMGAEPNVVAQCDVVLIDVRAPLRSARQAVAAVAGAVPHAPIIAMSADVLASGRLATEGVARELGVAAVLVKPFDRDALMQALEQARGRS